MKNFSLLSLVLAAACTSQTAGDQTGRLQANSDAQHVGIAAYAVKGDVVTLFDKDGIEVGQVAVSAPTADRRVFTAELADGTLDDAEVYRPLQDGRFVAPVTPDTVLTATLADRALASTWAAHQVRFTLNIRPRLNADQVLAPSDAASTTRCVGTATNHNLATCTTNCDWQADWPYGCARPGNLNIGCTNPSQFAPTITYNNVAQWQVTLTYFQDSVTCTNNAPAVCASTFGGNSGGGSSGFVYPSSADCEYTADGYAVMCGIATSGNSWTGSCPGTVANSNNISDGKPDCTSSYDAVPRLRDCNNPGSCTKSQGARTCTTYH